MLADGNCMEIKVWSIRHFIRTQNPIPISKMDGEVTQKLPSFVLPPLPLVGVVRHPIFRTVAPPAHNRYSHHSKSNPHLSLWYQHASRFGGSLSDPLPVRAPPCVFGTADVFAAGGIASIPLLNIAGIFLPRRGDIAADAAYRSGQRGGRQPIGSVRGRKALN